MITFKPIVNRNGRRRDGTWPVKIRITFKRRSRQLRTNLACADAEVTRSGRIKSAAILERANELIAQMRAACSDLSPFIVESWNVDDIVAHIRKALTAQKWTLDFFDFADKFLTAKRPHTRTSYETALNTFERFLGRRSCDINQISRKMLLDFVDWYEDQPAIHVCPDGRIVSTRRQKVANGASAMYVAKLAHIYSAAKYRYNDEDSGQILIPRSPFAGLNKSYPPSRGQRPLEVEVIQKIIDARPENYLERIARAAFMISFCTMGANLADLLEIKESPGEYWRYNRRKTRDRRPDGAEIIVSLPEQLSPFVEQLCAKQGHSEWWLPELHRWKSEQTSTVMINKGLRALAKTIGVAPFSFYSARHTWATLARRLGVEKATVDEALAHIGDFKVADIYAERNWKLAWEANEKVLALFRW